MASEDDFYHVYMLTVIKNIWYNLIIIYFVWNVNGLTILRGCNFSKPLIIIISLNNNNNNSYWSKNPNKGLSSIQNMTNTTKSTLSTQYLIT